MLKNYGSAFPSFKNMIHGADYNPEQWLHMPEVLEEDIRLMKLSGSTTMSVGIFSWAMYEPREGEFHFQWMREILDRLYTAGINVLLATPSGSKPAWLSIQYPETCMVDANRIRAQHGGRHNHCRTSPVYREKTSLINRKLAEEFGSHPAVIGWHVSNEYSGDECHCENCYAAFREWLKKKYGSLEELNLSWWSNFWSHKFNSWDQIANIDSSVHCMFLDWKRFITDQTVDFYLSESAPLRELTPELPLVINMMGFFEPLNYWKFSEHVDVISFDSYPSWHAPEGEGGQGAQRHATALETAFMFDLQRSLKKGKPWLLMESTPSNTNWQPVGKLKRPGMHQLSALQAVAHGSDSVQYFQWRKSRGSCEKFHGAVVDHVGNENTRVFQEVARVGKNLSKLSDVLGTTILSKVGIIYDWENLWAINASCGPNNINKNYNDRCLAHYRFFWEQGIGVDLLNQNSDFSGYDLIIGPMLYMVRENCGERIESFVEKGGTFVTTYWSGVVDEQDLCFLGGFPGPLSKALGIWAEECDALYPNERQEVEMIYGNSLGFKGLFKSRDYAERIHLRGAEALGIYKSDFYKGEPALTKNSFGKGNAYYLGTRLEDDFLKSFYCSLCHDLGIEGALPSLPAGISTTLREDGENRFLFVLNFTSNEQKVDLGSMQGRNLLTAVEVEHQLNLEGYGIAVIRVEE